MTPPVIPTYPKPTFAPRIGTLMVIDDNEVDQMIYRRIIRRSKMVGQVMPFLYATEALEYLCRPDRTPVDAILLDINMPRMDGFEFLEAATKRLGDRFVQVVVVMLTTSLDPGDRARAAQFPVVRNYFNKPLEEEHLSQLDALLTVEQPIRDVAG
ncbi:MAG: response regulator [Pseudomonadota bacterium]